MGLGAQNEPISLDRERAERTWLLPMSSRGLDSRMFAIHRRQVEPWPPLVPGAVVVGQVGVAKAGQVEEDDGGGDAAVAVGHGGAVGRDPGLLDAAAELLEGEKATLGGEEQLARQVDSAGNVAAAWTSAPGACVLAGVAGVDQLQVGLAQPKGELISGQPELQADPRRENGAGRTDRTGLDEVSLLDPAVPAALKHADRVVTIIIERHQSRVAN